MRNNTILTIRERVAGLVSQMTLAEKVSQMVFDAPAIERLGIPTYNWWNECLHGVGLAVRHGCDLNCGSTYPALLEAVEQGLISEETITRAVERLFTTRFRLGMFDSPEQVPYAQIPYQVVDSPQHRALALQAARESMVLLKNEGNLLPLPRDPGSVAVIGPNADDLSALVGNYSGTPAQAVTPLEGIRKKLAPSSRLYTARGCDLTEGVPSFEVIPSAFLRPAAASVRDTGLTATCYDNPDLGGEPARVWWDRTVDFIWKDTTPLSGQWGDPFSIRWDGYLVPPASGTYQLAVDGFSAYRLTLDGEPLVQYAGDHHPILQSAEVALEGGRFYSLRLEYASRGLDPQVRLLWTGPGVDHETPALEMAAKADLIVAVMGLSPRVEGEEMPIHAHGFDGGDRTRIELPLLQERLLEKLHSLGKPLVLVLLNGSALAIPWAAEHVPAIVEAWYPGQAGGEALADVLFGDYNPGGRLPVTFYRSTDDLPPFEDYRMEGRTYRYFRGEPLYPFGHGLSYTSFAFHDLYLDRLEVLAGEEVEVSASVTNTGRRAGDEVVQLYVRRPGAGVTGPIQELKGFKRIHLEAGECKTVTFTLHTHQLRSYDEALRYAVMPGAMEVLVGRSAGDLPLVGRFQIVGQPAAAGNGKVFFNQVQVTTE